MFFFPFRCKLRLIIYNALIISNQALRYAVVSGFRNLQGKQSLKNPGGKSYRVELKIGKRLMAQVIGRLESGGFEKLKFPLYAINLKNH